MHFSDCIDSLDAMKKKSLEDGFPSEIVERMELLVQVSSAIPDIGGLVGFLKMVNRREDRGRVVVVAPDVHGNVGHHIIIDIAVPLDVLSIVGATMDTFDVGDPECNCDKCKRLLKDKAKTDNDDKDVGKLLMFNKFKRNDECE